MATEDTNMRPNASAHNDTEISKEPAFVNATPASDDAQSVRSARSNGGRSMHVPIHMRILAVVLVSLIGFGSHWSSGVTGAMKSTLKKVSMDVNAAGQMLIA